MSFFRPAPIPSTALGYHRVLSPTASVRVSPLCLGAMNFGDTWKDFMGECSKETAFEIMDAFYEAGGNFIDTANNYQAGQSEEWVGEWMEKRGIRDEVVLATKYTSSYLPNAKLKSNFTGNSTKSLITSVEASLKKLKTSYIDILYLHWWDHTTSVEEVMRALNTLADQGKILYLGVSDTPAWIVSKANQYARDHGLRQFVVYQGRWNAANRDFERDIIPMVEAEGMAMAPWATLGGGMFKPASQREQANEGRKTYQASEKDIAVSTALEKIATTKYTLVTSVALAYILHKSPNTYPIVGGRTVAHIRGNIAALSLKLSEKEIEEIDDAVPFDHGFPLNFLFAGQKVPSRRGEDVFLTKMEVHLETVDRPRAIAPREG